MESLKKMFDRLLFQEYATRPTSLGIYRILYAACMLVAYLPQHLWIPTFPNSFFDPPLSLAIFFAGFPSAGFFIVLNALLVFTACCLLVGYRTQLASVSFGLLLLVGNSWAYSFGKINEDVPLVLIPLVMQFSGWGDTLSVDEHRGRRPVHPSYNAWPIALLALLMGFAMLTAAVAKARTGWLDPHSHAVLGHILRISLVEGRAVPNAVLRIKSGVLWESLDYSTVALEALFLVTVFRRRAFQIVCAVACFFHLGIAVVMQITVWSNVLAYGAFYDWRMGSRPPARKALAAWTAFLNWLSLPKLAVLSGSVFALFITIGNPFQILARRVTATTDPVVLWAGIIVFATLVASGFLYQQVRSTFSGFSATGSHPVILFDGACGLCNRWVDLVLKYDSRSVYRFAPLQSEIGQDYLRRAGLPADFIESLVLIQGETSYIRSAGALRILKGLGMPFSLTYTFILVPGVLRDFVYQVVAKHRIQWFGEEDVCRLPTATERSRFL